jgi:hypothetical protein
MTFAPKSANIIPANGAGANPAISNTTRLDNGNILFIIKKKKKKKKKV